MKLHWFACFSFALLACDFVNTPTTITKGQLYQSGDAHFDPFFNQVHQEQVTASNWADDSKQSRRGLVNALELHAGASNTAIIGATRDKKGSTTLGPTVESTITSERERAKKLSAAENRLEDLLKRGEALKKEAIEDREGMGADKVDEAKVKHRSEVKREVTAAVDATETMRDDAKRGSAEADELATKLRSVWGGEDAPAPTAAPPPPAKKTEAPARKPRRAPAEKPTDAAPVEKKPAPAAGEVFNP